MKKKLLLLIIPILIIIGGLLFHDDVKTIMTKVNVFKDEPPVIVESIDITIDPDIASEFTNSVQARTVNQHTQSYLTYDRVAIDVYSQVANSSGQPLRASAYLDTGVDYYFVFEITSRDGYEFIENIPVIIDNETVSETNITRHDGALTVLVDAPDVDLTQYGLDITPAPTFANLIEGYNSVTPGTFTILNTGSEALDNISIELSDDVTFDLDTTLLPSSLGSLATGTVKITPKVGLTPGVHNSTVTITANRLPNPVIKEIEVKVLYRVDYLDLNMNDLSGSLVDTNTEGYVSDLVYGSVSTTNQNPGYAVTRTNTKLTYLSGNNYVNINTGSFIDITRNYFYNIVVDADDNHAYADNVIVRVNNVVIPDYNINNNRDESNFDKSNNNKKIQIHIKASVPTHVADGVALPLLRSSNLEYKNGTSQYPDIIADPDLVSCSGSNQIYVGNYSLLCVLTDPDNYHWTDGTNTSRTLNWNITPIQTTLMPQPSNLVKVPKGNNVDLNTQVEKNSPNPLKCSSNGLHTGISLDGCTVQSNFEAVENVTTWFTIDVDGIDDNNDGTLEYLPADHYPISVTTISNKPTNLEWDDSTATWDKITGITSYEVSLYEASNNQEIVTETVNTNADNFTDEIENGKSYYFTVASNTNSGLGDMSDQSPVFDSRLEHQLTHELVDQTATYSESFSYPVTFTDNEGTITYNSSNPGVATIDNNGNITIKNVGTTVISVTASSTTNYKETTKSYTLTVIPKKLTKPTYTKETSFPYIGSTTTLDYPTNYDENLMTISGNYGVNAGKYKMIISLKDNNNYTWSDDSTNDITINWEIYKIDTAVYKIATSLNTSRVLDIKGGSKNNKANVQLYTSSNSMAQRYIIKYVKDGYYAIENVRSLKVLDVQGAKAVKGTNVWQYNYNGSNAQLWKIIKNSDGTYTFISKLGNFALDVTSSKTANGTNIQIYTVNGAKAQKFYLTKDNFSTGTKTIANGTYVIGISKAKTQVFEIAGGSTANKANLQLYKSNNSKAQKFKITYVSDGYYKIINAKSNKSLDVKGASQSNGANVWQYTYNGSSAQLWKIQKNSNGTYTFISRCNGKVLDAKGGKTANKTNIQVYTSNNSTAQKYYLTKK